MSVPSNDGLFAECKPVGPGHAVGSTYCDKGLIRFIVGDYVWAMAQALIVGYADPTYVLPAELTEALGRQSRPSTMPATDGPRRCSRSTADLTSQRVHITRHRQNFVYPLTREPAPEITVRHLWLNLS